MKGFLISIIMFTSSLVRAQDTLLYFEDLTFYSVFEEEMMQRLQNSKTPEYLGMFLAINQNIDQSSFDRYNILFNTHFEKINNEKLLSRKPEKKVKTIYKSVHDEFLKKYELQNHFDEIFTTGEYNCVSASALYGIVFSKLNIPFIIKEMPTHVNVVAYPDSEQILVETTDPSGGFVTFNDRFKAAFIERMKVAKLISEDEVRNKPTNQLFDEYYFSNQNIDLKQLVAIQYSNDAIYKLENDQTLDAYYQLEKAFYLYPSERFGSMLLFLNVEILQKDSYSQVESVDLLAKLTRFKNYGIDDQNIIAEFGRMTESLLFNKGDSSKYNEYFSRLTKQIRNDSLNHELKYLFYHEKARALYNQGHYKNSIQYFEKAYQLNPENLDIASKFVTNIGQSLRFESRNKVVITSLEDYASKYPQLLKNNIFKSMLAASYLIEFGQAYEFEREKEGSKYRELFENMYSVDLSIDHQNIGRAYSLAAVFYFKRGYKYKALNIIEKGLEFVPGNHELLIRKRMIN